MFISNRINKSGVKIDYHVFYFYSLWIVFLLLSRVREGKKGKSLHFPVKLIRFFVRSISCRRRASPGTVPALLRSRGLPVINFTSLKSQDFRRAEYIFNIYIFFSFYRSNKTNIIQTWMKAVPEGVKLWKMKTHNVTAQWEWYTTRRNNTYK